MCPAYQTNSGLIHSFGLVSESKLNFIWYMKSMSANGSHLNSPHGVHFQSWKLRYIPIEQIGFGLDGEVHHNSLLEIEMIPDQIQVMGFPFDP